MSMVHTQIKEEKKSFVLENSVMKLSRVESQRSKIVRIIDNDEASSDAVLRITETEHLSSGHFSRNLDYIVSSQCSLT